MNFYFVAGFDFGTSYSKVVLRDALTNQAKVIGFGDDFSALFPSFVRAGNGWISGPEGDRTGIAVSYPKLIAADATSSRSIFRSNTFTNCAEAASLLGEQKPDTFAKLILTRYFLSVINAIYEFLQHDDDWSEFDPKVDPLIVQIAVPTGLLDRADKKTEKMIRHSLMAATKLRSQAKKASSRSTIKQLKDALDSTYTKNGLEDYCVPYPEVAAGVQSILQSRNVKDGKYITLDVGAGTIDLNVFHRWTREKEHRTIDYWACRVEPLGFARLRLATHRKGRSEHETTVNALTEPDLMRGLENSVHALLHQAFKYQPYKTTGDGPSPWFNETYAYIWGGGSEHKPYGEHFLSALTQFSMGISSVFQIPKPNNELTLPQGIKFGRVAIAFGLSYHHSNLNAIRLPSNLKTYASSYGVATDRGRSLKVSFGATMQRDCSCRGNPTCPRCVGRGYF